MINLSESAKQGLKQAHLQVSAIVASMAPMIDAKDIEQLEGSKEKLASYQIDMSNRIDTFASMVEAEQLITKLTNDNKTLLDKIAELEELATSAPLADELDS